jgi:hypothetical protein
VLVTWRLATTARRLTRVACRLLQVVICVLHLQRTFVDEGWFSVLVATQQVLLWIKLVRASCNAPWSCTRTRVRAHHYLGDMVLGGGDAAAHGRYMQ